MAKASSKKPIISAKTTVTSSALSRLRALAGSAKPPANKAAPRKAKAAAKAAAKTAAKPTSKAKVDVKAKSDAQAKTQPTKPTTSTPPAKRPSAATPAPSPVKTKAVKLPKAKAAKATPLAVGQHPELVPAEAPPQRRPVLPRVKDMLQRVPSEHVQPPLQPVPHLLSEAHALFAVAKRYADKLAKIGFSEAMLDGLSLYAQALGEAQDDLDAHRGKQYSAAELKLVNQATELRNQILLGARLALRKDRKVLESLDAIVESEGQGDLARDLQDLAIVAESYPAQLSRLGLGLESAYKARDLARKLSTRPASGKIPTSEERTREDIRDRAATVLYELMTEARLGGAYVFRKEPRVALLFTATHRPGSR